MNLKYCAFISRHAPTQKQFELANEAGYILVNVGDRDAFTITAEWVMPAVAVVHPAAALRLIDYYDVLVFENGNRAPKGEPVKFEAIAVHVFPRNNAHA